MNDRPKIVVVGSLNVDHTFRVPRIPAPGETMSARDAFTCLGGKGANQALAAARAGGAVALIGCVGNDAFGERYLDLLRGEGIHTDAIAKVRLPTGSAFIAVDDVGENAIIVNAGANAALQPQHLEGCAALIRSAAVLLLQLECPLRTVRHAVAIANAHAVPVILNPSPLSPEFIQTGLPCDTLIINQHEADTLAAMTLAELHAEPRRALALTRCRQLIITRGRDPTLLITDAGTESIAPPKVVPVDTVGAGDAFTGAFAVAWAGGAPIEEAVRFANAAGALATQTVGAQPSIPLREDILKWVTAPHASGAG